MVGRTDHPESERSRGDGGSGLARAPRGLADPGSASIERAQDRRSELARIRWDIAGVAVSLGCLRVERALRLKYSEDQPREPAGQPTGGRWVSTGPSDSDRNATDDSRESSEVVAPDGSRVLSIRVRSNPAARWDEQHTVVSPVGERTVFETSGRTQTIRDGETGAILARSTRSAAGVEPDAFVQTVRGPRILGGLVARTIEAASTLFTVLSGRNDGSGKVIFEAPASEYRPGDDMSSMPIWVGRVTQEELDAACPRHGEVQALADEVIARVKLIGGYSNAQELGSKVHKQIAGEINSRRDPNFRAEKTYVMPSNVSIFHNSGYYIRLDVLERRDEYTVCVYDHKTGGKGMQIQYIGKILPMVQRHFEGVKRIIIIEVRPNT